MPQPRFHLALLAAAALLSGCYFGPWGEGPPQKPTRNVGRPQTIVSPCMCFSNDENTQVIAYFLDRPSIYPRVGRQTISTWQCTDVNLCPFTQGRRLAYPISNATLDLDLTQWTRRETINRTGLYYAVGKVISRSAAAAPSTSMAQVSADRLLNALWSGEGQAQLITGRSSHDCEKLCDPKNPSPQCELAPQQATLDSKVRGVASLFRTRTTGVISQIEFLSAIEQAESDCQRSPTTLTGGTFVNTGEACVLGAEIRGFDTQAEFRLPEEVRGQISVTPQSLAVDFTGATSGKSGPRLPYLHFDDAELQHDFGGAVSRLFVDPSRLVFTTPRGCVGLRMSPIPASARR